MSSVYLSYGGMITPIGNSPKENFEAMLKGQSGVSVAKKSGFNDEDWPLGRINDLDINDRYNSLLLKLCSSLDNAVKEIASDNETLVIVSTTKADVDNLPDDTFKSTRTIIQETLDTKNPIVILSNACISGVLAVNTAADYLRSNQYNNALVIGIDVLSNFVTYGFQSLFALSDAPSRPFDKDRKGISLGEAAGAILLSSNKKEGFAVEFLGGASSNDANHISGPSRTGEGLYRSIQRAAMRAKIDLHTIDFISAHGTGTLYNDEMESIAFDRLTLNKTPLNSLKGYFGHTLGAAGVIEILSTMLMMENKTILKSLGFDEQGTTQKINVATENISRPINLALKSASGFGGGNASLILSTVK